MSESSNVAFPWQAIALRYSYLVSSDSSSTRVCSNNAPTSMVRPFKFIYMHPFKIDDLTGFAHQEILIEEGLNIWVRWSFLHHWRFFGAFESKSWLIFQNRLVTNCNTAGFWEQLQVVQPQPKISPEIEASKMNCHPPAKKNEFPTLTRSYEWLWWAMHFVVVEDIDFRKKTKTLWLETNSINFIQNLPGRTRGVFAVESHTLTGGIYH